MSFQQFIFDYLIIIFIIVYYLFLITFLFIFEIITKSFFQHLLISKLQLYVVDTVPFVIFKQF
jgi:hypothetical protein